MRDRSRSSKETITLSWKMPFDAWDHWAQGRGKKSVRDVILEGIGQIGQKREKLEAVRKRCESWGPEAQPEDDDGPVLKHTVKIELPAAEWGEAIECVGRIDNRPVGTRQLLEALILESDSWKQCGDPDAELNSGWTESSLTSSLDSLTATTAEVSLASGEKKLALMVAWAAVVGALATVASAVDAWCNP